MPFCSFCWPALQSLEAGVPHHKGSLVGDASNAHGAQICNLLLVLAHGDAAVKAALARPGTLRALCSAMSRLPQPAQLQCLKCLKHLSCDPGMLEPLQVLPLTLQVDQRGRFLLAWLATARGARVQFTHRAVGQRPMDYPYRQLWCALLCEGRAR